MLPIFCTAVVIMFVMFFGQMQEKDFIYWLTIISYSFLAIYFFFLKRPYLKVGKDTVATRKLGKERVVDAQDLEYITIQPGYVIIKVKDKRSHWMFGRMFNLFDTKEMAIRLQEFAKQNDVTINLETK